MNTNKMWKQVVLWKKLTLNSHYCMPLLSAKVAAEETEP